MDIYICGIHPAYTYDRVCRGYTRCYVCIDQAFYVLQMYSRDDSDFETVSPSNHVRVNECTDEAIVQRICMVRDSGEFNRFQSGTIIDLDKQNSTQLPPPIVPNQRQLVRYNGKMYMIMYSHSSCPLFIRNDYDDEQTLKEILDVWIKRGLLKDVEYYCDIHMTEVILLYHD